MADYLTKEEMRMWRSSTEKCTLEEYAARLGKTLNPEKDTNDIVDIIYKGEDVVRVYNSPNVQRGVPIYVRPATPTVVKKPVKVEPVEIIEEVKAPEPVKQAPIVEPIAKTEVVKPVEAPKPVVKEVKEEQPTAQTTAEVSVTFKKELTDREQKVFEYLSQNQGKIVFAKDLAELLDLKRDYIYKYIKNLRTKIVEDVLTNSEQGGFIFKI